jgi:pilus assembly protein Flp/PilA
MTFTPLEKGQGMVEYMLILLLVAIILILILSLLGTQISGMFSQVVSTLEI